jgi:plastocyanin
MPKQIKYIIPAFVVIIIAGSVLFLIMGSNSRPTEERSSSDSRIELPDGADIVYTGYSFTPDDIAVESGGTVTIINEASEDLEFVSDPYPSTDANPELNIGTIASGESKSFTITKKGAWGYHNYLSPLKRGRITVLR